MTDIDQTGFRPSSAIALLPAVAFSSVLIAVAWATTSSHYAAIDLVSISAAYALLGVAIHTLALISRPLGLGGEVAHALIPGFLLAWHFREQTRPPGVGATLWTIDGAAPFLLSMLLGAGLYLLLTRLCRGPARSWSPWATAIAVAAFLVVWSSLYLVSPTTRWHLLNHNRLLGTPAYHLFATPTRQIESELWESHLSPVDTAFEDPLANSEPERRPDVVVVMLDTMRVDGLAAWGGDPALMPFLNGRAEQGWVLADVLSNSSWTRPSVASLFTGLLPEEHGAVGWEYILVPERVTLAEVYKESGYETIGIVANHQAITPEMGFGQGFDSYEILSRAPNPYARAEQVNAAVATWLEERRARESAGELLPPAFLYVHYLDPHTPYLVDGERWVHNAPTSHSAARDLYDRELEYLDDHLETLFAMVEEDLGPDTPILMTSDHGEEFGEHGQRGHGQSLYRELTHVPAILWLPGEPGARTDARLETRDLFDLALRLRSPEDLDMTSWTEGRSRDVRYASVSSSKDPGPSQWLHNLLRPYRNNILLRMSEVPDAHLIWAAYGDTNELYELSSDPEETMNVARARPRDVERLTRAMNTAAQWWAPLITRDITEDALEDLRALGYIR